MANKNVEGSAYVSEVPDEIASSNSSEPSTSEEKTQVNSFRRFFSKVRSSKPEDVRERRFLRKLDGFLLTYIALSYFVKYLDQSNTSNAYVSGMQTDLHLHGNERNLITTWFNIGIILGSVPSQLIQLKYVRPSIWIPSCEIAWSVLVMGMAGAKNVNTIYALRFFIGFFEAVAFPGYSALLGSWYGPTELGKRVALFEQSANVGTMFSGYLQAALYKTFNGHAGLAGWRWLFIFDGIISIPIAVLGYFAVPDLPNSTRAIYLNKEDREYSVQRMEKVKRAAPTPLTWKSLAKVYSSWQLWVFLFTYETVALASGGQYYFNLWLRYEKYSVVQINTIPTGGNAITVVVSLVFAYFADITGKRKHAINILAVLTIVSNIMLSVWNIPKSAKLFAFFLSFVGGSSQPILIAWGQEVTQHLPHTRQLLVATGNLVSYSINAWLPLLMWPTYDAPHYKYAYQLLILFGGLGIIGTYVFDYMHKREVRKTKPTNTIEEGVTTVEENHPKE